MTSFCTLLLHQAMWATSPMNCSKCKTCVCVSSEWRQRQSNLPRIRVVSNCSITYLGRQRMQSSTCHCSAQSTVKSAHWPSCKPSLTRSKVVWWLSFQRSVVDTMRVDDSHPLSRTKTTVMCRSPRHIAFSVLLTMVPRMKLRCVVRRSCGEVVSHFHVMRNWANTLVRTKKPKLR